MLLAAAKQTHNCHCFTATACTRNARAAPLRLPAWQQMGREAPAVERVSPLPRTSCPALADTSAMTRGNQVRRRARRGCLWRPLF